MSELINISSNNTNLRWRLLTTVSAAALLIIVQSEARAADSDRPTVWIELGGQLERVDAGEQQFVPPFVLATPRPGPETISPLSVAHAPRFSVGGEGKISFEPESTNWVFSAAIRYGRSEGTQRLRQQSYPTKPVVPPITPGASPAFAQALQFIDTRNHASENHAILDFQAGKDVGVGMFGAGSSSILSLGVRIAQLASKSSVTFKSDPDAHPTFRYFYGEKIPFGGIYHSNAAAANATRSFRGLGPSISWNASAPVLGSPNGGEVSFDWGANAAILFGRQKAFVHHQTTAQFHSGPYNSNFRTTLYRHTPPDQNRSRTVIVPNVGGFAGLSFRHANAKLSLGYRGDFFFGAMDSGIDAVKKENRGFYGPFATVSVGLGG